MMRNYLALLLLCLLEAAFQCYQIWTDPVETLASPTAPTGGHSLPAAAGADAGKPAALPPLAAAGPPSRRAAPAGPAECPGTWHSGVDVVRTPDCRLVCLHKPVHWGWSY